MSLFSLAGWVAQNPRSVLCHSPGGQKSEMQGSVGLALPEAPRKNLVPASLASGGGVGPWRPLAWGHVPPALSPIFTASSLCSRLPLPKAVVIGVEVSSTADDLMWRPLTSFHLQRLWSQMGSPSAVPARQELGSPWPSPAPLCCLLSV